jgi:hypothetical protein
MEQLHNKFCQITTLVITPHSQNLMSCVMAVHKCHLQCLYKKFATTYLKKLKHNDFCECKNIIIQILVLNVMLKNQLLYQSSTYRGT